MSDLSALQHGRMSRAALRARCRRQLWLGLIGVVICALALLGVMATSVSGPRLEPRRAGGLPVRSAHARAALNRYAEWLAAMQVRTPFRTRLRSGLLFDVRSGRVLWERQPRRILPIASLTKMMTALVVSAHARPSDRVLITRDALNYSGSGVGLLPLGRRVSLRALLYGLLLPSGNDAARALAQHVAGSLGRFVAMMNRRAQAMGLGCSHFSTVSGIADRANYSCAADLARIAHALLQQPLLARIVATRDAVLPFPIKGGKLFLFNNNPLMRLRFPGADGVKTGYTQAAGQCLVAAARRGRRWLGVVLLHSEDPPGQGMQLLDEGFAAGHA